MSEGVTTAVGAFAQWRKSASMGIKLFFIALLALFMSLPALFVNSLVDDRITSEASVLQDVGDRAGGQQSILGPTLLVPYTLPAVAAGEAPVSGVYAVFPLRGHAVLETHTEERKKSLFRVPVYQADATLQATFDLSAPPTLRKDATIDWSKATLVVGTSVLRGLLADATVTVNGNTTTMSPIPDAPAITLGTGDSRMTMGVVGVSLSGIAKPGALFDVSAAMKLSGSQRVSVLAYGRSTAVDVKGDWANPGFDGNFLPLQRNVEKTGFASHWEVPFVARGVRADGDLSTLSGLQNTAVGVTFVEVADPYQSITRSLKYITLFLGLVFLSYFVFEATSGHKAHPAQYVLVGVAQLIFYLLLLALAERTGFDVAFAIAGAATVILLSVNAQWVFRSTREGVRGFVVFSLLYGLIYCLLRLEDNALLVGAGMSFAAVAAAMYFTRNIAWYGSSSEPKGAAPLQPVMRERWLE